MTTHPDRIATFGSLAGRMLHPPRRALFARTRSCGAIVLSLALLLLVIAGVAGCAGRGQSTAQPAGDEAADNDGGPAAEAGEASIGGTVADVAASAGLIVLAQPVDGVSTVVIDADGEVYSEESEEVLLETIRPGDRIAAAGRVVSGDTLLARTVRIEAAADAEPTGEPREGTVVEASETDAAPEPDVPEPAITLEAPAFGQAIASPVEVRGALASASGGGAVRVRVFDSEGRMIGEAAVRVEDAGGQQATFRGHVPFDAPAVGGGTVEVMDLGVSDPGRSAVRVQVGFDGTPSIDVSGIVGAVYSDPPLITLDEPVHGFGSIRLGDQTMLGFLNGANAVLSDIAPGKAVWASGFGGESGTLVAYEVVLLENGAARESDGVSQTIEIEAPQDGSAVSSPLALRGSVAAVPFEGTLVARLYGPDDTLVAEHPFIVDGEMGQPARFTAEMTFTVPSAAPGRLEVVEISARDGSIVASAEIDVELVPPSNVTIVARVASVFLSARVIDLGEQVEGFDLVALTDSTAILSANGERLELIDIELETRIEASGRPGAPGTLIAEEIRVVA